MLPTRLFLILGASFLGTVLIGVLVVLVLSGHEKAARSGSTEFAAALVRHDAKNRYVADLLAEFGPIASARVVDTRNTRHGRGESASTWFVGDVLMETAKGPMVVELAFNGGMLVTGYDKVTGVEELAPADVPDGALSDAELARLAKAYHARSAR